MERLPDGVLRFFRPNGEEIPAVPPLAVVGDDPTAAIAARLAYAGVSVDKWTGYPTWDGGVIDWHAVVDGPWEPPEAR